MSQLFSGKDKDNTVRNEEGTIDTLFHNHTLRTGGKPKGRRT